MRTITRILKDWLKAQELCVASVRSYNGFYANVALNRVYYGTDFDFADELFYAFAIREGLKVNCGHFVISFLHEVGHLMTDEFFTDEEQERLAVIREELNNTVDSDDSFTSYFMMDDERLATAWAVDYANAHANEVQALKKEIEKVLDKH